MIQLAQPYQQRRIDAGKCAKCGRKRGKSKRLCNKCLRFDRERKRQERGGVAWKRYGPGRPPLVADLAPHE